MKAPCIAVLLALSAGLAGAHKAPSSFPEGARALTTDELQRAVEDRVFTAQPAGGPPWELRYDKGGRFAVTAGAFSDEGQWSPRQSTLCTEGKKLKPLCNELRVKDGVLFMKRKEGEVLRLIAK